MTTFATPIGVPPATQFVAVGQLTVDPKYQRSIDNRQSRKLIEHIAKGWDWRLCLPLIVSARPTGLFVIDGQHRAEGARLRGDIPHLPACVGTYASPAEEAAVFVAANRHRKAITKLDDFHAALAAGDAATATIASAVRAAGLSMADTTSATGWKAGELGFTTALRIVHHRQGEDVLRAALSVMGSAFAGEVLTHGAAIFGAIVAYLDGRTDRGTVDALDAAIGRKSAAEWGEHPYLVGVRGGGRRVAALRAAFSEAVEAARMVAKKTRLPIDLNSVPSVMEQRAAGWGR